MLECYGEQDGTTRMAEVYVFHLGCVIMLPTFEKRIGILQYLNYTRSSTTATIPCEQGGVHLLQ